MKMEEKYNRLPVLYQVGLRIILISGLLNLIHLLLISSDSEKANILTLHRLISLGLNQVRAVFFMHFVEFIFGIISAIIIYLNPITANVVFILWLIVFFVMIYLWKKTFPHIAQAILLANLQIQ